MQKEFRYTDTQSNSRKDREIDRLREENSELKDEFKKICVLMKRTPNLTELGIFSAMWNEHCSYKSSRKHLKNLYRLGFGGGFYDNSLAEINSNKCLGLGYEFQILDEFDIEPHDFKLGRLITPEGYFKNAL